MCRSGSGWSSRISGWSEIRAYDLDGYAVLEMMGELADRMDHTLSVTAQGNKPG
jgi:hypothetical protein